MPTLINALQLGRFLEDTEAQMTVEANALDYHIHALKAMVPVFQQFDGKVINKRLTDELQRATKTALDLRKETYGTYIDSRCQCSMVYKGSHLYASDYKEVRLAIESDANRLDAGKTLDSVAKTVERLQTIRDGMTFDADLQTQRFNKFMEIDAEIEKLFDGLDTVTSERLKKDSYRIR